MPSPAELDLSAGGGELVRVLNTENSAIPPFGALEIIGYSRTGKTYRVRKPTINGRNDCLFNGSVTIPTGRTGQAIKGGMSRARLQGDGNVVESGQIWGVVAGSWALHPGSTGYTVRAVAAGSRGGILVSQAPSSLVEWVRITGGTPGGGISPNFYPAIVLKYDASADSLSDSVVACWFRDIYRERPEVGEYLRANHQGNGGIPGNYRPVYMGRTESLGDDASSSASASSAAVELPSLVTCSAGGLNVTYKRLSSYVLIGGRRYTVRHELV